MENILSEARVSTVVLACKCCNSVGHKVSKGRNLYKRYGVKLIYRPKVLDSYHQIIVAKAVTLKLYTHTSVLVTSSRSGKIVMELIYDRAGHRNL